MMQYGRFFGNILVQRGTIKRLSIRKSSSGLGVESKLWKAPVFYECSHHAVDHIETTLIERSFAGGIRSIVTRSSSHLPRLYELLLDLHEIEEDNAVEIGHILQVNGKEELLGDEVIDAWRRELQTIAQLLHKKNHITFINISFSLKVLLSDADCKRTIEAVVHYCQQEERLKTARIGIDCSSASLINATPEQLQIIISNLAKYFEQDEKQHVFTIATNYMTLQKSKEVIASLNRRRNNISILGTEILRLDPYRPGQLSDDYRYLPQHKNRHQSATDQPTIKEALADFNLASNNVIKAETELLNKHRATLERNNIPFDLLCVGMMLMHNIDFFHSPEEWSIVLESEVLSPLEKQYDAVKKINSSLHDWVTLHRPLARYLFASFRNLLQARILDYRDSLYREYLTLYPAFPRGGNFSKEDTVAILARTAKDVSQFDSIGITLTKLNVQDSVYEILTDPSSLPQGEEFQRKVLEIVPFYNSPFFLKKKRS